ncbi:MAG: VWA domain-containing protein [Moraxellaceae bacterium]|nr:VWA domain-containing protein [Moraxellaceae bacterium]
MNTVFKFSTLSISTLLFLTACTAQQSYEDYANVETVKSEPIIIKEQKAKKVVAKNKKVRTAMNSMDKVSIGMKSADMAMSAPAPTRIMAKMVMHPTPVAKEKYQENQQNPIHRTTEDAISTFGIDTDTGSYANVRRFLNDGKLPPKNAIRYEELINYFNYDFTNAKQQGKAPFKVSIETVKAPWRADNQIVKVGIKAVDKVSESKTLPPANLVFLVDVSGSMSSKDKLDLAKSSLKMLTKFLRKQDTISLVTYSGNSKVALPATNGAEKAKILSAIDGLTAEGSTNGEGAIKMAYNQAQKNFKKEGINRILMMTDGDFNVGVSDTKEMLEIIKRNRDKGISLSTFGFGSGNYNEYMMEQVADNGNGNYSYIDSLSEAKKALVDEMSSTFNTVAKDVKVQVEFNPSTVSEWRLIGYENRALKDEDFNNDKVDAGELGAGKSVIALFEITPVGNKGYLAESRYQAKNIEKKNLNELGFLKIRYKAPQGTRSQLLEFPINKKVTPASQELKFALAVAGYGQLIKGSKYSGDWTYMDVKSYAKQGFGKDSLGTRHEFVKLVDLADALQ